MAKPRLSIIDTLGPTRDNRGFARATSPRALRFPEDHGPHPEFRSEWWYFTGNLEAGDGRRFGYQFTVFRFALAPATGAVRESAWATNQVYMAHFALSDVAARAFHAFERTSRSALGLAGARASPFRVWVETWSAEGPASGGALAPVHVRAEEGDYAVDLVLEQGKAFVLQGDEGLSQKGKALGNASYYYSATRMPTTGSVRVRGESFAVRGASWMDREWSTSALEAGQTGWDWFCLQLDDGRDLMFFRLRGKGGLSDPSSSGSIVEPGGVLRRLSFADVEVVPMGNWKSPRSGGVYPGAFRLRVPAEGLDLEISPWLADQELDVSFRYWEGAIRATGTRSGKPIRGSGYLELTGYAERAH